MRMTSRDDFGRPTYITPKKIRHLLDLLDDYMKGRPYEIHEIWQSDVNDRNGRIDVQIVYKNEHGFDSMQKLLILKDEVIDGLTFHARSKEWY